MSHQICFLSYFISYFLVCGMLALLLVWLERGQNLQNCAILCCVLYSQCGNRAVLRQKTFERSSSWFSFWRKKERNTWLAYFILINEFKDQVCSSWFAPVVSASDYPLLSKWVLYGELACNCSCSGTPDEISPIYSLWATFIGLYIANYVVERSTGSLLLRGKLWGPGCTHSDGF